jgi:hypothetical protein
MFSGLFCFLIVRAYVQNSVSRRLLLNFRLFLLNTVLSCYESLVIQQYSYLVL